MCTVSPYYYGTTVVQYSVHTLLLLLQLLLILQCFYRHGQLQQLSKLKKERKGVTGQDISSPCNNPHSFPTPFRQYWYTAGVGELFVPVYVADSRDRGVTREGGS